MLKCLIGRQTGWWFQTFGLYSIIYGNIWDNPSHWLIFFKMVETTNQWLQCSFWAVPPRISAPQTLMTDWNWSYKNINSGYNHAPGHLAENTNKVTRNGLAYVYIYIYILIHIYSNMAMGSPGPSKIGIFRTCFSILEDDTFPWCQIFSNSKIT